MGKRKKTQAYIPENLEYLAKSLVHIRDAREVKAGENLAIDVEGLQEAIKALPKKDRENVERFWGLEGGINHSRKLHTMHTNKDIALLSMGNEAVKSLRSLFRIDYMYMYDKRVVAMIEELVRKIDKKGMSISDIEAIKYVIAFFVVLQNGPKMSFEEDPLDVDKTTNPDYSFDEYCIIQQLNENLKGMQDESINLRMIYDLMDMLDLKDSLAIKKSFCIEVPKGEIPEEYRDVEIEPIYTFAQIREFKERVFPYGSWETVDQLILSNPNVISRLGGFLESLDTVRRNWAKVLLENKVGETKLMVSKELRDLVIYDVGGLKFTDIYEIMFLYVERNLIGD